MAKPKRRKVTSIPLSAIPERKSNGTKYSAEFKAKAVAMLATESASEVGRKLHVTGSTLMTWQRAADPYSEIRRELEAEERARAARLDRAAFIVEAEGLRGRRLAVQIRALVVRNPAPKK